MQEIRNEASLENMESYLEKLSENDRSAINMLSGVRGEGLDSLGESLGENLGDMLVDWGSDYFSAEKREARKCRIDEYGYYASDGWYKVVMNYI